MTTGPNGDPPTVAPEREARTGEQGITPARTPSTNAATLRFHNNPFLNNHTLNQLIIEAAPPRTAVNFAKAIYLTAGAAGSRAAAALWQTRAEDVRSAADLKGILRDLTTDLKESPGLMAGVMHATIGSVSRLPLKQRPAALGNILEASSKALPNDKQGALLKDLIQGMKSLVDDDPVEGNSWLIDQLGNKDIAKVFDELLEASRKRPPAECGSLVESLAGHLHSAIGTDPEDPVMNIGTFRWTTWNKLLDASKDLDLKHKGPVLDALQKQIAAVSGLNLSESRWHINALSALAIAQAGLAEEKGNG